MKSTYEQLCIEYDEMSDRHIDATIKASSETPVGQRADVLNDMREQYLLALAALCERHGWSVEEFEREIDRRCSK